MVSVFEPQNVIIEKGDLETDAIDLRMLNSLAPEGERIASTNPVQRFRCKGCGTMLGAWFRVLGAEAVQNGDAAGVSIPTMLLIPPGDHHKIPEALRPQKHVYYNFRVADFNDGLPKFSEGSKSELVLEPTKLYPKGRL